MIFLSQNATLPELRQVLGAETTQIFLRSCMLIACLDYVLHWEVAPKC